MAYATAAQVAARAGRLASWTDSSRPSTADIVVFLDDVAAELDAALAGRGITAPATGPAADALRAVNADGALVLALQATYPDGDGPAGQPALLADARQRYERAVAAVHDGTHPAVRAVEAAGGSPSASSLWSDDPGYLQTTAPRAEDVNPWLAPAVYRGQTF